MSTQAPPGIPVSTLNPKYLNSNSTSHTWPFSAIAELIDNAYDPDVNAKQFFIDKTVIKNEDCLTFMDNGNGMDYETMHKMLSFGYSDKVAKGGKAPIGMYGNGFKSGSMRLGKDAIVFSKTRNVRCVGMLSQTYLQEIEAQQIVVPIVCFEKSGSDKYTVCDEQKACLQDILRYSPFKTQEELLVEIDAITSFGKNTGTRIIIWNLRRSITGTSEFDFETDPYDIKLPPDAYEDTNEKSQSPAVKSYIADMNFSLRAYCKILYLKPRMQIIIRGQNVKSELIAKSLALTRKDKYIPAFLKKPVLITFGYNTRNKEQYGAMMYHKNRFIKAYERVGCQLRAQSKGVGVIAVIECDFLEPTHNKQHFLEADQKYRNTMNTLGRKLEEYWEEIRYKKKKENPNSKDAVEDTIKQPDQNWVQCDSCLKWRKLPDGVDSKKLPGKWFCRLNTDPQFRNCEVEEEPQDLEDEPAYDKTYKKQRRSKNMTKKQQMEEPTPSEQILHQVAAANKPLNRQCSRLRKKLFEKPDVPSSIPTTSATKLVQQETISDESPGSVLSPASNAACSQSSPNLSLVITDICSLATPPAQGQKRPQPDKILTSSKKPKILAPPEASAPEKAADVNPKVLNFYLNKQREEKNESQICRQMEHSDSEATVSDPAESNTDVTNTTTQTAIRARLENISQPVTDVMEATIFTPHRREPLLYFPYEVEEVTKERDSLQEQVHMLTCQLQETQARIQALSQPAVEQQRSSAAEERDYKSLFEKAQQRVDELLKEKEALQAAAESNLTQVQCQEECSSEAFMQIDSLLMELNECRMKRDGMLSECEQLMLKLKQAEDAQHADAVSPHTSPGQAEMAAGSFSKRFSLPSPQFDDSSDSFTRLSQTLTQPLPGIPVSTLNPKYLHANSTSHTWPFGAIAQLIDNAYDPDVNAKQFWINKTVIKNEDCLTFMDNGNGMDYETMHKMLSFGYSDKVAKGGKAPIGMYGNGFKSGSMRLGKDAIVFSKTRNVCCVGMLSQTYLQEIEAQQIVVPIVCFEKSGSDKYTVCDEQKASLQDILRYSPFKTQEELLVEIDAITSFGKNTGTRIIIWNLRRSITGTSEFDFKTDPYDIRLPPGVDEDTYDNSQFVDSLRAYCRILYLKPRMQIIIRGQNVKSELIAKSLALTRKSKYIPTFLKKPVPITFGYNTRSKEQYGAMMYHKNRLIKAYERVGCQLLAQSKGVGVIAVIECDYLEPTHNKQHFLDSDKFRNTMHNLGVKLKEYWAEIWYKRMTENPNSKDAVEDTIERPDQNWVQCDSCLKWRKLPDGVDHNRIPDKWYCGLNPDPQFRNCDVEEQPED